MASSRRIGTRPLLRRRPLVLLAVAALCLANMPAASSGSIGPGSARSGKSVLRAEYARGKAIVHSELVCRRCPIKKRAFNRARARTLKGELDVAIAEGVREARDEHVRLLCSRGVKDEAACKVKLKVVRSYLERRYRL